MTALVINSHNPIDCTSGPIVKALPTGQTAGFEVGVEKVDPTTNPLILTGSIRGVAGQLTLRKQHETLTLRVDGSGSWWPVGDHKIGDPNDFSDTGYDLILCAGQSNMAGRGTPIDVTRLDVPDTRVWQYGNSGVYINTISLAAEPLDMHNVPSGIGPALGFARLYAHTIPTNRRVLLVPVAQDSSAFSNTALCWKTDGSGTVNLYLNAIAQAQGALAASGANSRFVGMLWLQGENDAGQTALFYQTQLDLLIDALRANIPTAANSWFVLGQMLPDIIAANPSTWGLINGVHIDTPRRKTLSAFAYGEGGQQMGDNLHYNAVGQRFNSQAMFAALTVAKANIIGTAPVAPTVFSFVQSGTSVTTTWNTPVGRATDYNGRYSTDGGATWTAITRTSPSLVNTATITASLGATLLVQVETVNEQGTSAWSASGSFTLATIPAQVTGLASSAAHAFDQPLTWTAIGNATGYLVEYKLHSSGTWLTSGTVTPNSADVSPLVPSSSYDYRVTALNAAGSGTASSTLTTSTSAVTPLIDAVGVVPFYALGLRKLYSTATKSIRVRRSSDNTQQDIGFVGSDLDTATLLTFAGSGSAYIVTWYDQSGNGRDLTQNTTTSQSSIVVSGVLNTANSKPIAQQINLGYVDTTVGLYAAAAASVLTVAMYATTAPAFRTLFAEVGATDTGNNTRYQMAGSGASGGFFTTTFDDNAVQMVGPASAATPFAGGALHQMSMVDTGAAMLQRVDSGTQSSTAYVRAGHTLTITRRSLGEAGAQNGGAWLVSEVVAWSTALTSAQELVGDANQRSYWGTP